MLITSRRRLSGLLMAVALTIPGSAFAACKQSDLAGVWRVNLDTGYTPTGENHALRASCIITIKANGTMTPGNCMSLVAGGDSSIIFSGTPAQLRVGAGCEANWGKIGSSMQVQFGTASQFVQKIRLTMSSDKHTMLGYGTFNDVGILSVHAIRRSP